MIGRGRRVEDPALPRPRLPRLRAIEAYRRYSSLLTRRWRAQSRANSSLEAKFPISREKRIKSFRVARRRESSVGLTRGRGAAGYGIFKRDERARSGSVTRGRGEAGAGAGLWCGKGRKSGVGEGVGRWEGDVAGDGEANAGCGMRRAGKGARAGSAREWGDGKEMSRGTAKQTRVVACGACGVDGQGGDGRRSGSRSQGVFGGESANKEEMTDLTTRAGWWLR